MNSKIGPSTRLLNDSRLDKNGRSPLFLLSFFTFIISLGYTLVSIYSYSFPSLGLPAFLRIPRMSPGYADLRQLTYTSGCSETFSDLLSGAVICDPFDRPFNYPWSTLKVLRLMGVNGDSTELLGGLLGFFSIVVCLIFIFSILRSPAAALWLSSLFLLSFPFQLVLERGNYELIIFCGTLLVPFVLFSSWFTRCLAARGVTAALLSFLVTALKIHPVAGLAPWALGLAITWPVTKSRWIPILIFIFSSLGIIIQLGDIPQMLANTPNSDGWLGFGLRASYQARVGNSLAFVITLLKLFIILASASFFLKATFKPIFYHTPYSELVEYSRQSALLFSIMLLAIWMISKSWDYRLIFALGIIPFFINNYSTLDPYLRTILRVVAFGAFFVLFEGYVAGNVVSPDVGDYIVRFGRGLAFISNVGVQPALLGFVIAFLLRNRAHLAPPRALRKT